MIQSQRQLCVERNMLVITAIYSTLILCATHHCHYNSLLKVYIVVMVCH